MTILLIILLVLLLAGGGWGYNAGHLNLSNPLGIILLVVVVLLLFGLLSPYVGYNLYR